MYITALYRTNTSTHEELSQLNQTLSRVSITASTWMLGDLNLPDTLFSQEEDIKHVVSIH